MIQLREFLFPLGPTQKCASPWLVFIFAVKSSIFRRFVDQFWGAFMS